MYTQAFVSLAIAAMTASQAAAVPYSEPLTTATPSITTITSATSSYSEPLTTVSPSTTITASTCTSAAPPSGETYVTGFPLCQIPGFTETSGTGNDCYKEIVFQTSGATLEGCRSDCIREPTCKSYAYAEAYGDCLFFDHVAEDIQLYEDASSKFVHYDICCAV